MSNAGRKNTAFINTGTYATPTWTRVCRISDVKIGASRAKGSRKYRCNKSTKNVRGYVDYSISFKYEAKGPGKTDAAFDLLSDAFHNETDLDMAFLNALLTYPTGHALIGQDAEGIRGQFGVFKLDRDESDEEGTSYDIELAEVAHEEGGSEVEVAAYSIAITATV